MTQMQTATAADVMRVAGGSPLAGNASKALPGGGVEGGNPFSALLNSEIEGVVLPGMALEMGQEVLLAAIEGEIDTEALADGELLDEDGNPLPLFPAIAGLMQAQQAQMGESVQGRDGALLAGQRGTPTTAEALAQSLTGHVTSAVVEGGAAADDALADTIQGDLDERLALLRPVKDEVVVKEGEGDLLDGERGFGRLIQNLQGETLTGRMAATSQARGGEALARGEAQGALYKHDLEVPFGRQGWGEGVGSRLAWMVGNKQQTAELRLNPPHLGTIEVRINIHNDQASVAFVSQHANVREALESAIPRLREMLGESGIGLDNVDVSDQSLAQRQEAAEEHASGRGRVAGHGNDESGMDAAGGEVESRSLNIDGLLDTYV